MSDLLLGIAFIAFAAFLVPGKYRKYAAIAGWTCIVLNLFSDLPAYGAESNFLYPALALLSVPFLLVTVRELLQENPVASRLSVTAGIATLIVVPVALIPPLRDTLVAVVIGSVYSLISALGHHPWMYAWDIIVENGFYNQIIPGCTGILAIAIVLGIIAGVPGPGIRQRILAAAAIVPAMFLLNIARVAAVFVAVSDHWFDGWPDPTGTGDANFFWAHNVIAEALAVLFLLLLLVVLSRFLPGLGEYVRDVQEMYMRGVRTLVSRRTLP